MAPNTISQEDEKDLLDIEVYDFIYGKDYEIKSFFDNFIYEEENWKKKKNLTNSLGKNK